MLDDVQIIRDQNEARFAVIPYDEYLFLRSLLSDQEKLADYLDYLHVQGVKQESSERYSLEAVRQMLGIGEEDNAANDVE